MPDYEEIVLGRAERGKKSGLAVTLIVLACYLVLFRGPGQDHWDTYIALPAALISGEPVTLVSTQSGEALHKAESRALPDSLVLSQPFGISTRDQPIGTAVLAAPFYKLLRAFGFRLFYGLVAAFGALIFFCLVHQLTGKRWLAFVGALLLTLNPLIVSFPSLNPNLVALLLVVALFLVLETEPLRPFVAGLLLGVLGGVTNMTLVFLPLLLVWIFLNAAGGVRQRRPMRRMAGLKALFFFLGGAFLAILPFLHWKQFAFGTPLALPCQFAHLQGYGPESPHSFLGLEFTINGLLNFPFIDHWVRTPHFPFPVFLLIPLLLLSSLGTLGVGFVLLGIPALYHEHRRLTLLLIFWLLIGTTCLTFQENWQEQKMSFLFVVMPPIVLFCLHGLSRVVAVRHFKSNLVMLVVVALVAAVGLKFAFYLEFPPDQRWYQRFPQAAANRSGLDGLPEERRLSPDFFLTRETDEERLTQKKKLCRLCILPCSYLPTSFEPAGLSARIGKEVSSGDLEVSHVWAQIYDGGESGTGH